MGSRYKAFAPVDENLPNNAQSYEISMIGWNKKVLELGPGGADLTRAMRDRNCHVTCIEYDPDAMEDLSELADHVIVADLNDPATLEGVDGTFDVIVAGDVIEHLLEPQRVVNQLARLLAPGGKLVVSLPHIAHVDIRLGLLQGRFDYSPLGLLDETHIRFFTIDTIKKLLNNAGLMMIDLRRVRVPALLSEIQFDRSAVDPYVLGQILQDPEALTYQFVFSAVRKDGDSEVTDLALRVVEMQGELDRMKEKTIELSALLDASMAREALVRERKRAARATERLVRRRNRRLRRQLQTSQALLRQSRQRVRALQTSTSWKVTRPLRLASRVVRVLMGRK